MKTFLSTLLFCVLTSTAIANEGSISMAGGSVSVFNGASSPVSLDSEYVYITLDTVKYHVEAVFYFFNNGPTIAQPVGFPNYGLNSKIDPLINFESWVNDKKVDKLSYEEGFYIDEKESKRMSSKSFKKYHEFAGLSAAGGVHPVNWYIKHVVFPSNKITTTRISYTAMIGYPGIASYLYGTGRTWKGPIKQSRFIVKTAPDVSIIHAKFPFKRRYIMRRLENYTYHFIVTNYKPILNETFDIYTLTSREGELWEDVTETTGNYKLRFNFDDSLTEDKLKYYSLAQLRYLRNAFYARYGRTFDDPELDKYFRSRGWYTPNPQYRDTLLTDIERANIGFIVEYEKRLKQSFSE